MSSCGFCSLGLGVWFCLVLEVGFSVFFVFLCFDFGRVWVYWLCVVVRRACFGVSFLLVLLGCRLCLVWFGFFSFCFLI